MINEILGENLCVNSINTDLLIVDLKGKSKWLIKIHNWIYQDVSCWSSKWLQQDAKEAIGDHQIVDVFNVSDLSQHRSGTFRAGLIPCRDSVVMMETMVVSDVHSTNPLKPAECNIQWYVSWIIRYDMKTLFNNQFDHAFFLICSVDILKRYPMIYRHI